jgi:cytosine/adenosine deaminase-related metal-dependent hydrolase
MVIRDCDVLVEPGDLRERVDLTIVDGRVAAITRAGERARGGGPAGGAGAAGAERAREGGPADGAGAAGGERAREGGPAERVVDGRGLLAIPGLVNAHTHSPENCVRGAGATLPLEPWLCAMFAIGGEYDAEAHELCALAGAAEMLRSGTTGVVDHLWMTPASPASLDGAMRGYERSGMRAVVAPLMEDVDVTDRLAARLGVEAGAGLVTNLQHVLPAAEQLAVLRHAFDAWHGAAGGRLRVLAGPGGVQWASEELLLGCAELARSRDAGIHIHLLETRVQDAACREAFGCSGLQRLDRLGLVTPELSLPHSVWIDAADVETIAAGGATVVHNPAANTRLGSGRAPVPELLAAGVHVALGTDGSASSDNQLLWQQLKLAALIHNDGDADRWVTPAQALTMATSAGARAMARGAEGRAGAGGAAGRAEAGGAAGRAGAGGAAGRAEAGGAAPSDDGLGTLRIGAPADVALLDRRGPGLAGAVDVEAALALSEDGRAVRHVFVAGEQVVADGRVLTFDADEVDGRIAELAARRSTAARELPEQARRAVEQMRALRRAVAQKRS